MAPPALATVVAKAGPAAAAPESPRSGSTPRAGEGAKIAALGGTRLPKYAFGSDPEAPPPRLGGGAPPPPGDDGPASLGWDAVAAGGKLLRGPLDAAQPGRALLDGLLISMWDDAAAKGLFRYDVTACPTKVLPGNLGFVAQLNEGRATKKRPTEFRMDEVGPAGGGGGASGGKGCGDGRCWAGRRPWKPDSCRSGAAAAPSPLRQHGPP
jgi:hypothetical protein